LTPENHPWLPLVSQWRHALARSREEKKRLFQNRADECMRFLDGDYNWLYAQVRTFLSKAGNSDDDTEELPIPSFKCTVNKAAELVQLFGPPLYHKNPNRKATPTKPAMLPIEVFGDPNDPTPGRPADRPAHDAAGRA
jgi:hypothetical protein